MNERIKKIRTDNHLTQERFAARLGVKRNTVATYEMGRSEPSDAVISLICREFYVNEEWLRHGIGDPYLKSTHNDLTAKAVALLGRHDPMFEAIVEAYCDLVDYDREVILKSLQNLVSAYNEKKKE